MSRAIGDWLLAAVIVLGIAGGLSFLIRRLVGAIRRARSPESLHYFVSFAATTKNGMRFGWVDLTRDRPIAGGDDIRGIAEFIAANKEGLTDVSLLCWQPFERGRR